MPVDRDRPVETGLDAQNPVAATHLDARSPGAVSGPGDQERDAVDGDAVPGLESRHPCGQETRTDRGHLAPWGRGGGRPVGNREKGAEREGQPNELSPAGVAHVDLPQSPVCLLHVSAGTAPLLEQSERRPHSKGKKEKAASYPIAAGGRTPAGPADTTAGGGGAAPRSRPRAPWD